MLDDTNIGIVDVLTKDQRLALESLGIPVSFPPGHTIFFEGQPSRSVLIIQRGNVKVTQRASDGTEVILALRGEGVMGDEGVLMDELRSASITTITRVVGLDIGADDVRRFVSENNLWPVMFRAAVQRRRRSDQRALLARQDVRRRLTCWLLDAEVGKKVEDGWIIESLSQQDLAASIGASRDAVAIELRKLREQGLISTGRRRILLRDRDALRRVAPR